MLGTPEIKNPQASRKIRSYSEATRMSHVNDWRASGLSMSMYSAEHDISVSALSKWIKYYSDRLPEPHFKEVSLKNGTVSCELAYVGSMLEIKMPNGIQLKMPLDGKTVNWPQLLGILVKCI